jgi:plastocyanin
MRLRSGAGVLVVAGALLLAACGGGGPTSSSSGTTTTVAASGGGGATSSSDSITISNFMFGPMNTTVAPGATVTVTNKDSATHTLTATGGAFNTGNIAQNQTKTFKAPTKPGKYSYICDIHQYMTGTLTVS